MSVRRRIKAIVNIGAKRKIKEEIHDKPDDQITTKKVKEDVNNINVPDNKTETITPGPAVAICLPLEQESSLMSPAKTSATTPLQNTMNRTPTRVRTESFNSPTYHQNYSTASMLSQTSEHHPFHSPPLIAPTRDNIAPRHRKILVMEDSQRLKNARKEFKLKYSRKLPETSALKMFDFIYYNPASNPMKFDEKCSASSKELANAAASMNTSRRKSEIANETKDSICIDNIEDDTTTKNENDSTNNLPVPQLKLGPNGEIMLDEKSLVIETTAEKQARSNLAAPKKYIYLDEYSGNNGFYSRQKRTKDWSPDETIKFYRCLHTIGTDFSLMLTLFPNRSRRDLKLKFKKEEKFNGDLVNKAILYPKEFNIEELQQEFDREEELHLEEIQKLKLENEEKAKALLLLKNEAKHEKCASSKAARSLTQGDLAYKYADIITEKKQRKIKKHIPSKTVKNDDHGFVKTIPNINNELNDTTNTSIKIKKHIPSKTVKDDDHDFVKIIPNINNELNDTTITSNTFENNDSLMEDCSSNGGGSVEITDIGEIFSFDDIIPQLKDSSLALVSSVEENSEKPTHELYIMCKKTGVLSNQPLDLPKDTIDCILMAMGKYEDVE